MVKGRFCVNPFEELVLTPSDISNLQQFAYDFFAKNIAKYEGLISNGGPKVDEQKWKHIKTKEQSKVYVERDPASGSGPSSFPALLLLGKSQGTVEDCMFGASNPTLETMRIKASYVDDMSGGAVLATIEEPTVEEPFRSLTVKWIELDLPLHSTHLIKNRDYVYVEYMNIVTLSNGERIGCQIFHSVNFPQTVELPNRVRANMTVCGIFRQVGTEVIEIYGEGVVDPAGDMIRSLVVPSMATGYVTTLKYAHCGRMRKLAYLLEKRYAESKEMGAPNREHVCVTCHMAITNRRLGDFAKSDSTCKLCFGFVCRNCKIQKKMSFVTSDLLMEQRKVSFCAICLNVAKTTSTAEVARQIIKASSASKPTPLSLASNASTASVVSQSD